MYINIYKNSINAIIKNLESEIKMLEKKILLLQTYNQQNNTCYCS
jgi:hypothetical protein